MTVYDDIRYAHPTIQTIQTFVPVRPAAARLRDELGNDLGSAGGTEPGNMWAIQGGAGVTEAFAWVLQESARVFALDEFGYDTAFIRILSPIELTHQVHAGDFNGTLYAADLGGSVALQPSVNFASLATTPAPGATLSEAQIFRELELPSLLYFYNKDRNCSIQLRQIHISGSDPFAPPGNAAFRVPIPATRAFSLLHFEGKLGVGPRSGDGSFTPAQGAISLLSVNFDCTTTGCAISVGQMANAWVPALPQDVTYFAGPSGVRMRLARCVPMVCQLSGTDVRFANGINGIFCAALRSTPDAASGDLDVNWDRKTKLTSKIELNMGQLIDSGVYLGHNSSVPSDPIWLENEFLRLEESDNDLLVSDYTGQTSIGGGFIYQEGTALPSGHSNLVVTNCRLNSVTTTVRPDIPTNFIALLGTLTTENPNMRRTGGIISDCGWSVNLTYANIPRIVLNGQQDITLRNLVIVDPLATETNPVILENCNAIHYRGVGNVTIAEEMASKRRFALILCRNTRNCTADCKYPGGLSVLDLGSNNQSGNALVSTDPISLLPEFTDQYRRGNYFR